MLAVNQFHTDIAFHPGETLSEKLHELSMGVKEFAIRTAKPEKTIIAIIHGESSITPDMAVLFESVLQIPARFWINKQFSYDEYKAREKRAHILALESTKVWARKFPFADMVRKGWINPKTSLQDKASELFNFFAMASPEIWGNYYYKKPLKVEFRISLANTSDPYSISAWLRQGEIQVEKIKAKPYSDRSFKEQLVHIKALMKDEPADFFIQLQKHCLEAGVKVVYTPCIKKAPISGATRWINNSPIIQLSGRYNQNDRFWFTFFHEAGHIILHGRKDIFLEESDYSEQDKKKEEEADNFAKKWTFSDEEEEELLNQRSLDDRKILAFAHKIGTNPAMIIGRFHHTKRMPYASGRQFFKKIIME